MEMAEKVFETLISNLRPSNEFLNFQLQVIHLAYFFVIVIVFVVAYGVSTQVMLFPNYPIDYQTFKDVILSPWFKVLQQMDEYEVITGTISNSAHNFIVSFPFTEHLSSLIL